jgi:hypothetical protein
MNALTLHEAHEIANHSVDDLVKVMLEMEQADCPVLHFFHEGIYIREVRFPAGVLAIGHIQRFPQMNVFIQGRVAMLNPDSTTTELAAPMTFVGSAGRKVGYVLEDVIWQNIYPNPDNEQDVEVLEAKWLETTPYFEEFKQSKLLSAPKDECPSFPLEHCPNVIPRGWSKLAIRTSPIHGQGLFAESNLYEGAVICPAVQATNHSDTPNAKAVELGGAIYWVATRDIHGRRGGLNGEEITVDYHQIKEAACPQQLPQP